MQISIVDDDENFCDAVRQWTAGYIEKSPSKKIQLYVYKTSKELFQFLGKLDKKGAGRTLVLLDLDLDGRKTAGIEALARIRRSSRRAIRKVPVVIYSNSDDPGEIDSCYLKFANSYVWKGNGYKEQKQKFFELVDYWSDTAIVPANRAAAAA